MFSAMNPSVSHVRNAALCGAGAVPVGACAPTNAGIQMADRTKPWSNFISALLFVERCAKTIVGKGPPQAHEGR